MRLGRRGPGQGGVFFVERPGRVGAGCMLLCLFFFSTHSRARPLPHPPLSLTLSMCINKPRAGTSPGGGGEERTPEPRLPSAPVAAGAYGVRLEKNNESGHNACCLFFGVFFEAPLSRWPPGSGAAARHWFTQGLEEERFLDREKKEGRGRGGVGARKRRRKKTARAINSTPNSATQQAQYRRTGAPIVDLMYRHLTFCQFFFSRDTRKLMAI